MIRLNMRMSVSSRDLLGREERARKKAQMVLDEQIIKDSNFFAPEDRENLQQSALRSSDIGNGRIVWNTPYARRLYYNPEYDFATDKNPNAGGLWYETAKARHFETWKRLAEDAYRKGFRD